MNYFSLFENYSFQFPIAFWVILIAFILIFVSVLIKKTPWHLGIFRFIGICFLIIAAASPYTLNSSREKQIQALIDVSNSISTEAVSEYSKILIKYLSDSESKIKIYTFAGKINNDSFVIDKKTNYLDLVKSLESKRATSFSQETDLSTSIQSAFLKSANASFLIATDGRETKNNVLETSKKLSEQGLKLYPIEIEDKYFSPQSEVISGFFAPLTSFSGEQVNIMASIRNPLSQSAASEIEILIDDQSILSRTINIPSNEERIISLQSAALKGGLRKVTAKLKTKSGIKTEERWISVKERDRILLVSGTKQESRILEQLIRSKGYNIDSVVPSTSEPVPELQGQFSRIIINNTSYKQLGEDFSSKLKNQVELGAGVLIVGGDRSFGLGGYLDTPLDEISPLKSIPPQTEKKRLPTAVMLIIDKSGSMSRQGKMQSAQLAALTSIRSLKDDDLIGIIGFDYAPMLVIDLTPAGVVKPYASERLANLRADGKTNLLPALQAARQKLSRSSASRKHIIVLSDGDLPGENDRLYLNELEAMSQNNITLSAVAIGVEADVPFMRLLAQKGKGLFHHTIDPTRLPQIFLEDIYVATGEKTMQEQSEFPVAVGPHGIISSSVGRFPSLRGFVETLPKKGASLELITRKNNDIHPIMASWTLGKGKIIAFSSDASGRWSGPWLRFEEFSNFWSDLIKSIKNDEQENKKALDFDLRYSIQGRNILLDLVVFDEVAGAFSVSIVTPSGEFKNISLKQEKPGRFKGIINEIIPGDYAIDISNGSQVLPPLKISIQPESLGEVSGKGVNYELLNELARITQGVVNPDPKQITASIKQSEEKEWIVWPFILLATVFFMLEIWIRERSF